MDREKKINVIDEVPIGVTWMDGRCIFKDHDSKWGKFWYGICHFSQSIWAVTPLDYIRPTQITTITVSSTQRYCEKASVCLNFNCQLNNFDRISFVSEFKDCGSFSLSLPKNMNKDKPLWFSEGDWINYWKKFTLQPEGGMIKFDPDKNKNVGDKDGK